MFFRFNGNSFKTEPSSKYSHENVGALGNYRGSPFVTGGNTGVKKRTVTEILNYKSQEWNQADDYPFVKKKM